uniref:Lebercilin domain-containing protein n=1 Tax=Romanomermis culicivorax TaxID=13658 RepID=A0A915KQA8_ROMCU
MKTRKKRRPKVNENGFHHRHMKRPNRDLFEKHIASLNVKIEVLKDDYYSLVGPKCYSNGTAALGMCQSTSLSILEKQRSLTASLKRQREQTRAQLRQTLEKLHESQQKIKTCKNEMAKVESQSLYYKDERKLLAYLARLEKQYADMQTRNAREEKALITLIDKAKRNQKQLAKWRKLESEKEDMIKTLNELKTLRDALYRTVEDLKAKEIESRNNERSSKIQIKEITTDLNNLYQEKRRAISEYENERQLYADSRRCNNDIQKENAFLGSKEKLPVQRTPSGRPIVHHNDPDSDLEK